MRDDPLHVFQYDQAASVRMSLTRELQRELAFRPYEASRRVVIIRDCDRMREDQYSALLKSIEEPGATTLWVLTSSRLSRVPATIRSRCQVVKFVPLGESAIARVLGEHGKATGATARTLAALASGSLARAITLSREDAAGQARTALAMLDPVRSRNHAGLWKAAQDANKFGRAGARRCGARRVSRTLAARTCSTRGTATAAFRWCFADRGIRSARKPRMPRDPPPPPWCSKRRCDRSTATSPPTSRALLRARARQNSGSAKSRTGASTAAGTTECLASGTRFAFASLILVASGIVLGAVTWMTGMEARTATMLRALARTWCATSTTPPRPSSGRSVAGDENGGAVRLRESQRSFELAALVAPDGRRVRCCRAADGARWRSRRNGPGALLAVTDTLPAAVNAPRPRIASVVVLGRGPLAGHRVVIVENLERRLKMAQLEALEQALPTISAGLLLVVAITLLLDRWLRRPASRLEETANRIASGDYTARARLTGTSELDRVGGALDHMAEEIERARREMQSSRRTAEILLDSLPFAVILTDRDTGRVLFMNARWHETTQQTVQPGDRLIDQLGKELLLHLDGTPYEYEELATPVALRTGKPAIVSDIVTVRADGRRDHESAHATPISLGGERDFDAVLTVVQDRKEIMALAGEVRAWEQRFQRVVEATGQVVYEWNFEDGTVRRSGNQEQVLGFTAEHERTTNARANWEERMHPDDRDRVVARLEECLRTGEPFDAEYRTRRAPGQYVTIDHGFFDRSPDGASCASRAR
jgi:PAS domain-containing protein